ncbi:MAG: ribosome maturation factor RimP [Clostridiales bacterium]|nr:ribosome maturation factor RimP [Clostridiales bacterium]
MAKGNTVSRVAQIIAPYVEELGLSLWDIRFLKEGTSWYLRIFIDKEGGVSVDDCADLARAINQPLDDADPISQSYYLEVCSPGVERELVQDAHFDYAMGQPVFLRSIRPMDGVRDFSGVLKGYQDGEITVELQDGTELTMPKKELSYIKLDDFQTE